MLHSVLIAGLTASLLCLTIRAPLASDVALPERAPIPQPREEALRSEQPSRTGNATSTLPASEGACRKDLLKLGVTYTNAPAVETNGACALPHPIEVTALSPTIALTPPAVMNCKTARAASRLFQGAGMEAAIEHFDSPISGVVQASAYVCRSINGGNGLSEHAFGNALDVSRITLFDGTTIAIKRYAAQSARAKLLKDIREAACGPFNTVLGPGTNADHSNHFHFDMKERRSAYCR